MVLEVYDIYFFIIVVIKTILKLYTKVSKIFCLKMIHFIFFSVLKLFLKKSDYKCTLRLLISVVKNI